jgi:membrane protein YdbS with pleckstrin-like domain
VADADPLRLREPARRVDPRARLMWRLGAATEGVFTLLVAVVVMAVWDAVGLRWWLIALLAVGFATYAVVVPEWRWRVHRWEVTDTAVYTQTGWWSRERRIAPMSRIQTVDLAEGPVERAFRLATVTVTTASAAGALQIAGLDRTDARLLVDELTRQADAVEGDAT